MSLSFILFLVFLIFRSGFCENCSEALLENFRKTFNLSDKCDHCTIRKPESYSDNGNWSGICSRNRYLIVPKRKCGNSSRFFALVSRNACQIFDKNNYDFDDDCFRKFIDELCDGRKICKRSFVPEELGKEELEGEMCQELSGTKKSILENDDLGGNLFRDRTSSTQITTVSTTESVLKTKRTTMETTRTTVRETTCTEETERIEPTEPTEPSEETEPTEETEETEPTEETEETEPTEETEETEPTEETEETEPTEPTEETEETEPTEETEETEPTEPTEETKETEPTEPTEETEETEPTEPTEETEETEPTEPTEETKETEPTEPTEETEETEPTEETEETEETEPTEPTEETEETEPTEETEETEPTEETEETEPTEETEETEETEPTEPTEETEETEPTEPSEETEPTEGTKTSEKTTFETSIPVQSTAGLTKTSRIFKTTTPRQPSEICEINEWYFEDENHCYFLLKYPTDERYNAPKTQSDLETSNIYTSLCATQHPDALGLAVETTEENDFVLRVLSKLYFLNSTMILTSGIKTQSFGDIWSGWDQKVDQSVIIIRVADPFPKYYTIDPCQKCWKLWNGNTNDRKLLVMCERSLNPKNIIPELNKKCIDMYKKSNCYDVNHPGNYCCASDENGFLWFGCPTESILQILNGSYCVWQCNSDGYFSTAYPVCNEVINCLSVYNQISYSAPGMRYAIGGCPGNGIGFSTWFCGPSDTFIGFPDYSVCCQESPICWGTDVYLKMWAGCPNTTVIMKTKCPPRSALIEAEVSWYCQSNGMFKGYFPDYSNCNNSDGKKCSKKDRDGVLWEGNLGVTVYKNCPGSYTGECWWKCKLSGEFDGAEPDCTWCKTEWMNNISEKINNNTRHEEVVTEIEKHTQKEDLRMGYGHVLNLTSACVTLYKKQKTGGEETHRSFLKSYSRIFKNLAGNATLWSSFSVSSRKEYAENVVEITQNATFVNLEGATPPSEVYNTTLADIKTDGFDFFVAYNPSLKDCKFPLENSSKSDWHLEIKEVNESNSNFAVMGLVMNHSLSSLMFPQGEETEGREMNAPVLTVTVAYSRDEKAVVDHNVKISVSFKHTNSTRFPAFVEIKRKLHKGEKPSGVFNSTKCYHYSHSGWSNDGCTVTYTSKDQTDCTCTHLSTIGLLMAVHKYVPDTTLEIISLVCSSITILSLILALFVFFFLDSAKNDRALIGKNLCLCLLVGHVMIITVLDKRFFYIPDDICRIYAIVLHYVFMAAFSWMFVEGCHLYRMLVLVFDSDIEYRYFYLSIGYGVPFLIVGATFLIGFALQEHPYGQDELCWLKHPNYVWAFTGPAVVITSVNFCILIIAMKLAISSRTRTVHSNLTSVKLWLKGWFTLSSLLGITWLFGLALISHNQVFLYAFVIFNGLQGFFIFLFRCALNEQYSDVFLKRFKSLSSSFSSKKEDVVKSETKVVAISSSKSLSSCEIKTKVNASDSEAFGSFLKRKRKSKADEENPEIGINVEVTLKPGVSEAYLRNRMIAQNFAARRSKATWMKGCDNFRYKI